MSKKKVKQTTEFVGAGVENKSEKLPKFSLQELMSGHFFARKNVIKQLPFIGFWVILAFYYISNQFAVEKLLNKNAKLSREIKELRIEAITTSSDLMFLSKQSVILDKAKKAGVELEELTEPPRVIKIKK